MKVEWERPGVVRLTADVGDFDALAAGCRAAVAAVPTDGSDAQADFARLIAELDEARQTVAELDEARQTVAELDEARQTLGAGPATDPRAAAEPRAATHGPGLFHPGNRSLQDQFDTRRIADRIDELLVHDVIGSSDREFIERSDMFFLATADEWGRPNCSYKGGDPGFVRVLDDRTLAFPNYDGNGMFLSTGNITRNPAVGLLFIDFEKGHRLRVNGDAVLDSSAELVAGWSEAQFVVRVRVREVFPNCPRYIHRYQLVRRSSFVPRVDTATPVPSWKRSDWAADALPASDVARDPGREVLDR